MERESESLDRKMINVESSQKSSLHHLSGTRTSFRHEDVVLNRSGFLVLNRVAVWTNFQPPLFVDHGRELM